MTVGMLNQPRFDSRCTSLSRFTPGAPNQQASYFTTGGATFHKPPAPLVSSSRLGCQPVHIMLPSSAEVAYQSRWDSIQRERSDRIQKKANLDGSLVAFRWVGHDHRHVHSLLLCSLTPATASAVTQWCQSNGVRNLIPPDEVGSSYGGYLSKLLGCSSCGFA